jgi:hypothetical protein
LSPFLPTLGVFSSKANARAPVAQPVGP